MTWFVVFVLTLVSPIFYVILATRRGTECHHMLPKQYEIEELAFRYKEKQHKNKTEQTIKRTPKTLNNLKCFKGFSEIMLFFQICFSGRLTLLFGLHFKPQNMSTDIWFSVRCLGLVFDASGFRFEQLLEHPTEPKTNDKWPENWITFRLPF